MIYPQFVNFMTLQSYIGHSELNQDSRVWYLMTVSVWFLYFYVLLVLGSIVVSIPACHQPGSTLETGVQFPAGEASFSPLRKIFLYADNISTTITKMCTRNDRDRTRTCNFRIRSPMPYPLGHTASCKLKKCYLIEGCKMHSLNQQ